MTTTNDQDNNHPSTAAGAEQQDLSVDQERAALLFMLEDIARGRQQVDQAHREWTAALDAMQDPVFMHDKDYRIIRSNRAYAERAGLPVREVIGKLYYEFFPKLDGPLPHCLKSMQQVGEEEGEIKIASGEVFASRSFPVLGGDGSYLYSLHIMEDITERRRAENLGRSLLELNTLAPMMSEKDVFDFVIEKAVTLTSSKIAYLHKLHPDGNIIELVTWSKETLKHCTAAHDSHYPLDKAGVWADSARLKKPVIHNDYQNLSDKKGLPEGHSRIIRHMGLTAMEGGTQTLIIGVGNKETDYTEADVASLQAVANDLQKIIIRKRMEAALQESEDRFRQISATAQDAILMMDSTGRVVFWNNAAEKIFGYAASEALGKELHTLIVPERFRDAFHKNHPAFVATGSGAIIGKTVELAAVGKNGTEFPVELSVSAAKLGGQWHAVGFIRDITERKQAAEALRRERDLATGIIETAQAIILLLDTEGRILRFNTYMETLSGYTLAEVQGKDWFDIFLP